MISGIQSFFSKKKNRPSKIKPLRKGKEGLLASITFAADRMAFNWKIRSKLYQHLAFQLSNKVEVEAALENFRPKLRRRKLVTSDRIIGDIARKMRDGKSFSSSLREWIPVDEIAIISSGELAGNLPDAFKLVIDAKARIEKVSKAMKTAMFLPISYLALIYLMLFGLGRFVLPDLLHSSAPPSGMVAVIYAGGDFANSFWALLPPVFFVLLIIAISRSMTRWTGRGRIYAERFFPYSFYRDIQGYSWLMSFVALIRVGVPDVEVLKRQLEFCSPWLRERLYALWWRMDNGASLSSALMARGKNGMPPFDFPNPDVIDDIASLDGFNEFVDGMNLLAVKWANELEETMIARGKLFGILAEIVMYCVLGFMFVAMNAMSTSTGSVPGM